MPVFRATIGPKAEAADLGQHDAFIHGELTFRANTTEDAQTTLRYLTNFMSPGNLWFRVEEVPEAEARPRSYATGEFYCHGCHRRLGPDEVEDHTNRHGLVTQETGPEPAHGPEVPLGGTGPDTLG